MPNSVGSGVNVPTLSEAIALGLIDLECSGQEFIVIGDFEVDVDYKFGENCVGPDKCGKILMESGATISITAPSTSFFLYNIVGCTAMWNSITVSPTSIVVFADCCIEDGKKAVIQEPGSHVRFRRTLFKNNLNGIVLEDVGDHSNTILDANSCTFTGTINGLKSSFPAFNNTSYAGVVVYNKPNITGVASCLFQGIQNGLMVYNSCLFPSPNPKTLTGNFNVFRNIKAAGSVTGDNFGNGVYLLNGCASTMGSNIGSAFTDPTVFLFGHNLSTFDHNFENCERGINVSNARVFITNNFMESCTTAIQIKNTPGALPFSYIFSNLIENSVQKGIDVINNGFGYRLEVTENEITVDSDVHSKGIYVFGNGLFQRILIHDNEIDINTTGHGIEIESAQGVGVYGENIFTVTSTGYNYRCVYAHGNSDATWVLDNYFYGQDQGTYNATTTQYRVGLDIEESEFTLADCNVFNNVATSMSHKFYSTDALIRNNFFESGTDGYTLGSEGTGGSFIGEQSPEMGENQNEWPTLTTGDFYPSYDARSFHDFWLFELDNKFWVEWEDAPFNNNPLWPDKIQSVSGQWFEADLDVEFAGVTNCAAGLWPDPTDELSRIEIALLNDTLDLHSDYYDYRAAWAFLSKLDQHPQLLALTGVSQWQANMLQTEMGELYQINLQIKDALEIPTQIETTLDSIGTLQWDIMEDLYVLDSILFEDGNLDSTSLVNYNNLTSDFSDLGDEVYDIWVVYYDDLKDTLALLGTELDNISVSDVFNENLKTVMQIWLHNTIKRDSSLNTAQIAWLDTLGQTCRFVNGPSVVIARGMVRSLGIEQPYGDHPDCINDPFAKDADLRTLSVSNNEWIVFPTLTRGECMVVNNDWDSNHSYQLEVLSMDGTIHYQARYNSTRQRIDLSTLSAGMYFIRLIPEGTSPITMRVVKQ